MFVRKRGKAVASVVYCAPSRPGLNKPFNLYGTRFTRQFYILYMCWRYFPQPVFVLIDLADTQILLPPCYNYRGCVNRSETADSSFSWVPVSSFLLLLSTTAMLAGKGVPMPGFPSAACARCSPRAVPRDWMVFGWARVVRWSTWTIGKQPFMVWLHGHKSWGGERWWEDGFVPFSSSLVCVGWPFFTLMFISFCFKYFW